MRFDFVPPVLTLAPGDQAIGICGPAARAAGSAPRWCGRSASACAPGRNNRNRTPHRPFRPPPPLPGGPPAGKPLASDEPLATGDPAAEAATQPGGAVPADPAAGRHGVRHRHHHCVQRAGRAIRGDRDLAIQVAAARDSTAFDRHLDPRRHHRAGQQRGTGGRGDGRGVRGVRDHDAGRSDGHRRRRQWSISNLPSGSYKFRFNGAGFVEIWYPAALSASDATEITVQVGQQITIRCCVVYLTRASCYTEPHPATPFPGLQGAPEGPPSCVAA